MKCCQKHWDQLRKMVEDAGLSHLDTPETAPPEPYNSHECAVHCSRIDVNLLYPTLGVVSTLYTNILAMYGPGLGEKTLLESEICPLCAERGQFDLHLAGECTDPECPNPPVTASDTPWDEAMVQELCKSLLLTAQATGAMGPIN